MPALPYKGSPLSSPQPISGVLSLPTNKNQTLLFPADDAAPKVGCQLPLKQQEHQGTLQEPGTMPATLILPGNLYKALFEIYLYTVRDIDTDIYWFQVTNQPEPTTALSIAVSLDHAWPAAFTASPSSRLAKKGSQSPEESNILESNLSLCYHYYYFKDKACLLPLQHS